MILPGVTRDSVLSLARSHVSGEKRLSGLPSDLVVSERPVTMIDVKAAADAGNLMELFGAGKSLHSASPGISTDNSRHQGLLLLFRQLIELDI